MKKSNRQSAIGNRQLNPNSPLSAPCSLPSLTVLIKGAGEMATGIAHRLFMANITKIVMTEIARPITVRRTVAFSETVYEDKVKVEGVTAELVDTVKDIEPVWKKRRIAVLIDPKWKAVAALKPDVIVDAIMAKKNLGIKKDEASLVIGVGPGFTAPVHVHLAVESNRGQDLGRVFYKGSTEAHTGIPGPVMGYTTERVLRSPHAGTIKHVNKKIGDRVKKGDIVAYVNKTPVEAPFDGVLRGLIREVKVPANEKIGDIDPRGKKEWCYTITEKARAIGGGVLEGIMHFYNKTDRKNDK
ncbi:MAG: selenium-dependent molybdenum cofactor biosynthesis protein YqeB [Syntrophorhabdaceae bacterium]|nr:selenium-dependent molybdenum cofactor biosynthesis protein YqeB [Syntrophorhabdaceae bacterium]